MNIGGPAFQITCLMKCLDRAKYYSELCTGFCEEGEVEIDSLASHERNFEFKRINGLGRSINILTDLKALLKLASEIRRFNPHIIHTHTTKAGVLGRLASLISFNKAIRIHTFHGHVLHGYFSRTLTRIVILIEKCLASVTSALIAVGEQVKADLLNAGIGTKEKFHVIQPGFEFDSPLDRSIVREKLSISSSDFVICWIGRLVQIKQPQRILEIARNLKERDRTFVMLVAGDGPLYDDIQSQISKEGLPVRLLGWRKDAHNLLSASDIAINTSLNEGIPISIIQAQTLGIPAIVSDVGSSREVIRHGETGFVLEYSANSFAEVIQDLIDNPNKLNQMSINAKKISMKQYSCQELAKRHAKLYEQLLLANQPKI
jgi:glycosyltransferase involved in cell wall biosynthesis